MTRYLIRQSVLSLVKLFIFATLMFFFIQLLMPGDWVDQFSLFLDSGAREEMRVQLGLDLPIWERYLQWLRQLVTLDLGYSFTGPPIVEVLKDVIPPTLFVFVTGTTIAFLIGLWLGKRTAWSGSGFLSSLTTLGGITLFTSFPPWLAYLLAYFLAGGRDFVVMGERGGLRSATFRNLSREIWIDTEISPSVIVLQMFLTLLAVTAVILILYRLLERAIGRRVPVLVPLVLIVAGTIGSWYLLGIEPLALDILKLSWLPILTYTLLSFGETMLIMQSSMTEVLKEEYINTAHAKGLDPAIVREKHAARNALLPALSRLVISMPYLITGVVIIESAVGWPGMGTAMWNALYWQNMPLVMAVVLIVGVLSLLARLLLDVVIAYSDPRIRYDQKQPSAV
ncbi:MAG: ABC transporter permease [Anaerolineae bacterium]|jgi:peptide/nickel transport system permease protein